MQEQQSEPLLDKAYKDIPNQWAFVSFAKSFILIDGQKNFNLFVITKTLVTMIHCTKGPNQFVDAQDISGEAEIGEKLTKIVNKSVTNAKNLYENDANAVVSDNAVNMKKMGRSV